MRSEPSDEVDPYLLGCYAPIEDEVVIPRLELIEGAVPGDLRGTFVRNGANPRYRAQGRHHWFDGDGMLHAVAFADGAASYRNRYVQTAGFLAEARAGEALWTGLLVRPDLSRPGGPYKDTANTDVTWHNGQLLAMWWMGGEVYRVRLPDLETVGALEPGFGRGMAAHAKVDPRTGELIYIDHGPRPPHLVCGLLAADGALLCERPIALPGPRLQHDLAITDDYVIVFDLSMMADPDELRRGREKIRFFREVPTRIGLVRRTPGGLERDVQWFETTPFYLYHTINAWQEGDDVVLVGCRIADPLVGDPRNPARPFQVPEIANLRLEPYLHRWRLSPATGRVREEQLDDVMSEFPRIDDRALGQRSRYAYSPRIAPAPTLLFDGVLRYDLSLGASMCHAYADGLFGGEVTFAPREGGSDAEDDGYLVTIACDRAGARAEVHVIDAGTMTLACRLRVPARVPVGYHATWVPGDAASA
ncbi:MAG: carotenoid oxygenase family protein [Nannocystaceae bacterium]